MNEENRAYAECVTCSKAMSSGNPWKVEEWADLHESSYPRHNVRIHYVEI